MNKKASQCYEINGKNLRVEVNTIAGGGITVEDKRSGYRWKSGEALFKINCFDVLCQRSEQILPGKDDVRVVRKEADRLMLQLAHEKTGLRFCLELKLEGDRLRVCLPITELHEDKANFYRLKTVEINPLGFYGKKGEEGYLLLPNYSGIICRFTREEAFQYRNLLYLPQEQWEDCAVLPVFGTVVEKSGWVGIIESGDYDTEVISTVGWGEKRVHSAHACFNYRYERNDQLDRVDRTVTFHFLNGEDAGYVGMAKRYREYLVKVKGITPLKDKAEWSPEAAYIYDAYGFIKIFCAMKETQPDGSQQFHIYTTFDEAGKIMERFKAEGIEKAQFNLVGWNWDGHDGRYPARFPVDQRLGGEEGLRRLVRLAEKLNYQVTFHDNYSDAYMCSPDWDEEEMIRDRDGKVFEGGIWAGGPSRFICPAKGMKYLHRDLPRIKELGLKGWYYLDGTPRALRGCYDRRHGHELTRRAEGEGIADQFQAVRAYFGGCAVEMPTAFALPAVDEVSHIPCWGLWPFDSKIKKYCDEVVPFFHIAIHGLIIYHLTNWPEFPRLFGSVEAGILKEIEWGAMPRTEVTFRPTLRPSNFQQYENHIKWMKMEYDWICRDLGRVQLEYIENHRKLGDGVWETLYGDGTRVLVNYGKKTVDVDGQNIPPLKFRC